MQWGDRFRDRSRVIGGTPRLVLAGALALAGVAAGGVDGSAAATPLLFLGLTGRDTVYGLVGWIAGGAGILGVLLWGLGEVLSLAVAPDLLLGSGIAIGGGLGGVIRLLALGSDPQDTAETVTFEREADDAEPTPEPRPADLFEASQDPILYFDEGGDGPVVRAVNPAFEGSFGVTAAAVEDAPLGDACMVSSGVETLVAAASEGRDYRETVACETSGGDEEYRLSTATVSDEAGTRGYLLYTPLED